MGYSFELENANIIAHLVDGNTDIISQILKDTTQRVKLIDFFKEGIAKNNFYASKAYEKEYKSILKELKKNSFSSDNDIKILQIMKKLSKVLGNVKIKSMIVTNQENEDLQDEELLKELVKIHPKDSCLILQAKNISVNNKELYLFCVFKRLKELVENIDSLPGLLLWDNEDSIFIPVKNKIDIINIFKYIKVNDSNPIHKLKKHYEPYQIFLNKTKNRISLLHLSDLHIGKANEQNQKRLLELITKHAELSSCIPIVTGDLVDTPSKENFKKVANFMKEIKLIVDTPVIKVFGNHDHNFLGLNSGIKRPKLKKYGIKIFDEYKLIIIKICSNQGEQNIIGTARGKVTEKQLLKISEELKKVANLDNYTCIAILHHHPIEINKPDWYKSNFFERIFPLNLFEESIKLIDSEIFLKWCKTNNIKTILHGHRHIPNIERNNDLKINLIGAGSSTGKVIHVEENKTYISYNVIRYDLKEKKPILATTYYEELIGDTKHIASELLL